MDSTQPQTIRQSTISKLSEITAMERGTLTEEYRERSAADGSGTIRLGPYYKHQCWENGKNFTSRVPASQVPQVLEHMENGKRFDELTATLEQLAIHESRSHRKTSPNLPTAGDMESKKNSRPNASKKDTGKRKPS